MQKVYQTNFNPGTHENPGNCWQANLASLFDMKLEDVPHFMAYGDKCFDAERDFLLSLGYVKERFVHNPRRMGCDGNFDEVTKMFCNQLEGIGGYFSACVFSPKYFTPELMCDWSQVQPIHAVIIDKEFNIVHDPNPNYSDVKVYPLSDILGWNGVIGFDLIKKIA